jgi:hypothetical protein
MRLAWTLTLLLLLSGCLSVGSDDEKAASAGGCPGAQAYWVPMGAETAGIEVDGAQRTDTLVFFPNATKPRFSGLDVPEKWKWEPAAIASSQNGSMHRLGFTAPSASADRAGARDPSALGRSLRPVTVNWTSGRVDGCEEKTGSNSWRIVTASAAKTVQPGDGVAVYYAGFWLNGTLFSTNIATVDGSGWPRGGWYESGDNKPLNVYVYDKDRTEMTAHWSPKDPQGKPLAWSYYTTIKGFNQGLKGLSVGSNRVVVIPKEDAYGASTTSPLKDDTLVFYIDVVEIVDVPCPPETPNRALCRLPA